MISSCTTIKSPNNTFNKFNFDINKNYTFDEYVSGLLLINKNNSFPNINDIPD